MLGSTYFTDHPTVPRDSIVAQLNIDMVGRGRATDATGEDKNGKLLFGGPGYLQLIGARRLSTELGDLVERTNTSGKLGFNFDYSLDANGHPQNIYCRSDHWAYARYGIPVVFFTTGGHADYHQVTDEPQYIDYQPHVEDRAAHRRDGDERGEPRASRAWWTSRSRIRTARVSSDVVGFDELDAAGCSGRSGSRLTLLRRWPEHSLTSRYGLHTLRASQIGRGSLATARMHLLRERSRPAVSRGQ